MLGILISIDGFCWIIISHINSVLYRIFSTNCQDGVFDGIDQCDGTPYSPNDAHDPRAIVHSFDESQPGCPKDTDNDGVVDGIDMCPTEGGFIDVVGCPVDSDKDGVKDCVSTIEKQSCHSITSLPESSCCDVERDECNDTPLGATVDSKGCAADADKDGIKDGIDLCQDTTDVEIALAKSSPAKMTIDMKGCPILAPEMWEARFVDISTDQSSGDTDSTIKFLYTVDADLPKVLEARNYDLAKDMLRVRLMDSTCQMYYDAGDGETDTQSASEILPIQVNVNSTGDYGGTLPADTTPISITLDVSPENIVGSPIWSTEPPYDVGSLNFCVSVEFLAENKGEYRSRLIADSRDFF